MSKGKYLTAEQKDLICKLYSFGKGRKEISTIVGCSEKSVDNIRRECGLAPQRLKLSESMKKSVAARNAKASESDEIVGTKFEPMQLLEDEGKSAAGADAEATPAAAAVQPRVEIYVKPATDQDSRAAFLLEWDTIQENKSERLNLLVKPTVKAMIAKVAKANHTSSNELINRILENAVTELEIMESKGAENYDS